MLKHMRLLGALGILLCSLAAPLEVFASGQVALHGEDDPTQNFTYFNNDPASSDVALVRSLVADTTTFYVLPPGATVTFYPDGHFDSTEPLVSFAAQTPVSTTNVGYLVSSANGMEKSSDKETWSQIMAGDALVTGMYYRHKTPTGGYLHVKDVITKDSLWIQPKEIIQIHVQHRVPNDPQFLNVASFSDFADFNYASWDVVHESFSIMGTTSIKPNSQLGCRSEIAEALIPQRAGKAPGVAPWGLVAIGALLTGLGGWLVSRRTALGRRA